MKTIRFGIIGCGLMGREFASAAARWCHLQKMDARPVIVVAKKCGGQELAQAGRWFAGLRQHEFGAAAGV